VGTDSPFDKYGNPQVFRFACRYVSQPIAMTARFLDNQMAFQRLEKDPMGSGFGPVAFGVLVRRLAEPA
jgi:hypothetical protein